MDLKNRIKQKLFKTSQYNINDLLDQMNVVASYGKRMVICPDNTDANWLGVKNATIAMFKDEVFVIPQNFSNQVVEDADLEKLLSKFKSLGGTEILLSGFPNYFFKIIDFGNQLGLKVSFLFHGGLAELNQNNDRQKQMAKIFAYAKDGKLDQLFVVKEGLDILFSKLTGRPAKRITPPLVLPENLVFNKFNDGKVHIGIFGNNSYNKNRHNQVAAAAMIENSIIHIIGENEFEYLIPLDRVRVHNQLDRKSFLELLGSMDVNLYCSYSESWGQVVLESLALGVPCIAGNNSGLKDLVEDRYKNCFVDEVDNPQVLKVKIVEIVLPKI